MSEHPCSDLKFSFRQRKGGVVEVLHHGRLASTLRGTAAQDFLDKIQLLDAAAAQQLMARITGNYKRGTERLAHAHRRNR